ncbi:uncharacterized protein LOC124369200 [Homalodisca vitripennis]|uniref:uncharacterized protein LOC124369200 n=1 Tax=Homalodisca vitripennis TaxID=197043 RepID=UPI001EEAB898|nr:uncharacterized protein LOC124369200 [Homalodisca vitripennis]
MVDFSGGPGGLIEHGFSNSVFIVPGIIIFALSAFCGYKLFLCLSEREKKREEKKRLKQKKKK